MTNIQLTDARDSKNNNTEISMLGQFVDGVIGATILSIGILGLAFVSYYSRLLNSMVGEMTINIFVVFLAFIFGIAVNRESQKLRDR